MKTKIIFRYVNDKWKFENKNTFISIQATKDWSEKLDFLN